MTATVLEGRNLKRSPTFNLGSEPQQRGFKRVCTHSSSPSPSSSAAAGFKATAGERAERVHVAAVKLSVLSMSRSTRRRFSSLFNKDTRLRLSHKINTPPCVRRSFTCLVPDPWNRFCSGPSGNSHSAGQGSSYLWLVSGWSGTKLTGASAEC